MINFNFDMALAGDDDIEVVQFIERGIPRRINERKNYFDDLDGITFRKRFRISKECAIEVLNGIEDLLEFPQDVNNSVSPMNQLLVCLRFFSTGSHLDLIADYAGMHYSTVSRIIVRVAEAIATRYQHVIAFPNTVDKKRKCQQDFFNIASFPKVLGAIDCTHVKIMCPDRNEGEIYKNRKGYFSVNTQMICTADLKICNVIARWPGSAHDATIFNNSSIKTEFEQGAHPNCVLLGDSGYPISNYLLTPLLHPETPGEQLYNESHIRSRNVIERCFGVLKRRFPILAYGSRLKLAITLTIIVATSVLHNLAVDMGDNEAPPTPEELDGHVLQQLIVNGDVPVIHGQAENHHNAAGMLRRQLINNYFNR